MRYKNLASTGAKSPMQNHYNLLYREEEREMMPLCVDQGIGEETARTRTDKYGSTLYVSDIEADPRVIEQVGAIAAAGGVSRGQVALAWITQKPFVTAPIIGATKPQHLTDAVTALSLKLDEREIAQLEAPYVPHAIAGHA